jgi:hypothetical protein
VRQPTKELLQALVNLHGNPDFKLFMEEVKDTGIKATAIALRSEGASCHRAQGEALLCEALVELVNTAPATLQKITK